MKKFLHLLVLPVIACLVILAGPNKVKADSTAWFLRSSNLYRSPISNPITVSDIMSTMKIENWAGERPTSVEIEIDEYAGYETIPGDYQIPVIVNGQSFTTLTIRVYDNIKPTIVVPELIVKSSYYDLSLADIQSKIILSDNITSSSAIEVRTVSDNYSGNADKVGTYRVDFCAVDSEGNQSITKSTKIVVSDSLPEVVIQEDVVSVYEKTNLTRSDIISVLSAMGSVDTTKDFSVTWVADTYTTRSTSDVITNAGYDYTMNLKIEYRDGNYNDFNLTIHVQNDSITTSYAGNNWHNRWLKIKASIKNAWAWIKDSFKKLTVSLKKFFTNE